MRWIARQIGRALGLLCCPHEWEELDGIGALSFQACRWCPETRTRRIRKRNGGRPMARPTAT